MTSAVILHEILKQESIPHAILEHRAGFTERESTSTSWWALTLEKKKYKLMHVDAGGDNRDALALYWADRYILKQSHVDPRLIIVLSDGVPAYDYDDYLRYDKRCPENHKARDGYHCNIA